MRCQGREAIVLSPRPLIVDFDIPALYIPSFIQALENRCDPFLETLGRPAIEKPNHRHGCLLRVRDKGPRSRRATEKNNKVAPPHAFTSGRGSTTYHTSSMNGVLCATENPDARLPEWVNSRSRDQPRARPLYPQSGNQG